MLPFSGQNGVKNVPPNNEESNLRVSSLRLPLENSGLQQSKKSPSIDKKPLLLAKSPINLPTDSSSPCIDDIQKLLKAEQDEKYDKVLESLMEGNSIEMTLLREYVFNYRWPVKKKQQRDLVWKYLLCIIPLEAIQMFYVVQDERNNFFNILYENTKLFFCDNDDEFSIYWQCFYIEQRSFVISNPTLSDNIFSTMYEIYQTLNMTDSDLYWTTKKSTQALLLLHKSEYQLESSKVSSISLEQFKRFSVYHLPRLIMASILVNRFQAPTPCLCLEVFMNAYISLSSVALNYIEDDEQLSEKKIYPVTANGFYQFSFEFLSYLCDTYNLEKSQDYEDFISFFKVEDSSSSNYDDTENNSCALVSDPFKYDDIAENFYNAFIQAYTSIQSSNILQFQN